MFKFNRVELLYLRDKVFIHNCGNGASGTIWIKPLNTLIVDNKGLRTKSLTKIYLTSNRTILT